MSETSSTARTLRLLELLQARRIWSGADLAERLDVTPRTLRRDIDRLRELGYRIRARRGRGGGYELAPGEVLPPLVFTAAEGTAATDWRISDVRVEVLASALVWLVWPFEVLDSRELRELLRDRAARFAAAATDRP